jgi:hypothetical protein
MNKPPRYLVSDQFDLGMLASLTADITLTELSLDDVCQRIEDAEREHELGLHGGWAAAVTNKAAVTLVLNAPILLVARRVKTDYGVIFNPDVAQTLPCASPGA